MDEFRWRCALTIRGDIPNLNMITSLIGLTPTRSANANAQQGRASIWCYELEGNPNIALVKLTEVLQKGGNVLQEAICKYNLEAWIEMVLFTYTPDSGAVIKSDVLTRLASIGLDLVIQVYVCE
jgi:hypothetical protein